jgi:hypothetical protein
MNRTSNAERGMSRKALMVVDIQEDYTGSCAKEPFPYTRCSKFCMNIFLVESVVL